MKKQKGETTANGGIGVFGLLGIVFVTLKLCEIGPVATWSWWWVTAPFWGGAVIVILILLIVLAIAVIAARA